MQQSVVILTVQGPNVWLAKRSPTSPIYPDTWGSPGGKVEEGETPRQAASREMKEETGIEVGPHRLQPLGRVMRFFPSGTVMVSWFWVELTLSEEPKHTEPDVHGPWVMFHKRRLPSQLSPSTLDKLIELYGEFLQEGIS